MPTTIAIIEDNLEFLRHFSAVVDASDGLRLLGVAGNGRDGMALIERERADLYLIDLGLPDMDGVELIRHALRRHPDCDVVVVTVFGDDAHVMASIEAGATGYLLKDSAPAALLDCVRVLREGGAPVSPVIARKILQRLGKSAAPAPAPPPAGRALVTEREVEMLRALAKGLSFNEIGDMYTISPHTVARHVKNIYKKLAVHSRGEAVYEATALGLL
ncbi:response regulator [Rugamonas rubra]|jgi:DNA-binding NarL/FixJ family response regulator|uniref:Two component transcriptional regulator, LuxR family n=1 Tax=Rugamonas rubra TaxID=758825 RepID=A0A1I4IVG9_9BURK|nr:response regulator transcription factor [Rugamonas rubra]SFL58057.1 two component transcriptional regulator, LuxR family [Rugamonas rubra]